MLTAPSHERMLREWPPTRRARRSTGDATPSSGRRGRPRPTTSRRRPRSRRSTPPTWSGCPSRPTSPAGPTTAPPPASRPTTRTSARTTRSGPLSARSGGRWRSIFRGETARAGGWVARGQRLVDEHGLDGPAHGYLLLPSAFQALFGGGGPAAAYAIFEQATAIGERTAERDLVALGRHGLGQSLIMRGDVASGMALHRRGDDRGHRRRGRADRRAGSSTARSSRPATTSTTSGAPASGPPRSVPGARPSPSWSPTAGSAWCTAPR